jgi:hypothetical protein
MTAPPSVTREHLAAADLVKEVASRIPLPVDALEITAMLESLGVTDELARRRYGAADAFDLAEQVLVEARALARPAVNGPSADAAPTRLVTSRAGNAGPPTSATAAQRRSRLARGWALAGETAVVLVGAGLAFAVVGVSMGLTASRVDEDAALRPIVVDISPTLQPEPPAALVRPSVAPLAGVASASTALPSSPQLPPRVVLDERFADNNNDWGWPDGDATAWLTGDGYRLAAREPGRFVAVGAHLARPAGAVIVTAKFRKVGGPPGGGYGVIVRDLGPGPRDGLDQGGRYYVLGAGDRGDIGVWLRDHDHWVDLVPWTRSSVVRPGGAPNEVQVRAVGARLTLLVNGTIVASVSDATLPAGDVGIFVGGDGNEVLIERFVAELPAE